MNYRYNCGDEVIRVGVFVDKEFYGVFDYIENVFESTSESRVNEK